MSQTKKQDSREYKLEVLDLLKTSGKSKAQLECDLGLYPGQLQAWQKALAADEAHAFPGADHQTETEAELRRLRRENEVLRQERDILKKRVTDVYATRAEAKHDIVDYIAVWYNRQRVTRRSTTSVRSPLKRPTTKICSLYSQ